MGARTQERSDIGKSMGKVSCSTRMEICAYKLYKLYDFVMFSLLFIYWMFVCVCLSLSPLCESINSQSVQSWVMCTTFWKKILKSNVWCVYYIIYMCVCALWEHRYNGEWTNDLRHGKGEVTYVCDADGHKLDTQEVFPGYVNTIHTSYITHHTPYIIHHTSHIIHTSYTQYVTHSTLWCM